MPYLAKPLDVFEEEEIDVAFSLSSMGSFLHIAQPYQSMSQMLQIGPYNLLRLSLSLPTVILL